MRACWGQNVRSGPGIQVNKRDQRCTHLCLVGVVQVANPTGVKLAPSCGEGPGLLETKNHRWNGTALPPYQEGPEVISDLSPQALSPKERGQGQRTPPRRSTKSRKYQGSSQSSWAPAARKQGSRHPIPAGQGTQLPPSVNTGQLREVVVLPYKSQQGDPLAPASFPQSTAIFPQGREQGGFQPNPLIHPTVHLITYSSMYPSFYPSIHIHPSPSLHAPIHSPTTGAYIHLCAHPTIHPWVCPRHS